MKYPLAFALALSIGCTSSEQRPDRTELRGSVQVECGTVAHGPSPICAEAPTEALDCFVAAFADCTPARIVISQTYDDSGWGQELFVVAGDEGCDVVAFWKDADGFPPEGTSGQVEIVSRCSSVEQTPGADECPIVAGTDCVEL